MCYGLHFDAGAVGKRHLLDSRGMISSENQAEATPKRVPEIVHRVKIMMIHVGETEGGIFKYGKGLRQFGAFAETGKIEHVRSVTTVAETQR